MRHSTSKITTRREAAWLSHIDLLASLRYPAPALMPTILAAIRRGFNADFGTFGWVEGDHLQPVAFWSERMTEPVFRWWVAHTNELFAEFPLRQQLETDGEIVRMIQTMPGYEEHWHYTQILAPLGVRWAMVVPVFNRQQSCDGFLYLYRRARAGPFSDAEQTRLRRVRDRLADLHMPAPDSRRDLPKRPAASTVIQVDASGRLLARSRGAIEILYLCHDSRTGILDWAASDLSALPVEAQQMVRRLLEGDGPDIAECELSLAAGSFHFRAERLQDLTSGSVQAAVTVSHLEPVDIALARRLLDWPLSPQEKRLIVASVHQPHQQELAAELGITVGTLKSYINKLHARLKVSSRQQLIDRVLTEPAPANGSP